MISSAEGGFSLGGKAGAVSPFSSYRKELAHLALTKGVCVNCRHQDALQADLP